MELLLAIFIGATLIAKVSSDKRAVKENRDKYDKERAIKDRWVSGVENATLERETAAFIKTGGFLDEVAPAYDAILGRSKLEELYPMEKWCKRKRSWTAEEHERFQEQVCRRNEKNALRILLAKHGYVPHEDASAIGFVKFYDEAQNRTGLTVTTALDACVLKWCAEELKRNGVKGDFIAPFGKYGTGVAHWNISRSGV